MIFFVQANGNCNAAYNDHGNREVWPQLVVSPRWRRADTVLVNTVFVDQIRSCVVLVRTRRAHPEVTLEVALNALIPVFKRHEAGRTCNSA